LAGHTARHVELLDDIHALADLPVVRLKHEMTERESTTRARPSRWFATS
jgi:hypothetical protein